MGDIAFFVIASRLWNALIQTSAILLMSPPLNASLKLFFILLLSHSNEKKKILFSFRPFSSFLSHSKWKLSALGRPLTFRGTLEKLLLLLSLNFTNKIDVGIILLVTLYFL